MHTEAAVPIKVPVQEFKNTTTPAQEAPPEPIQPVTEITAPVIALPALKQGINSIDKLKQQIAQNKKELAIKEDQQQEITIQVAPDVDEPITQTAFERVWALYLSQLEADNKMSLLVILKNAKWQLTAEHEVEVVLASQHENEMFEEERINTIPFFRKNLKNTMFEITIKVNSTFQRARVFTAEDKFTAMAEKNPALNDLRKLFALDLE